MKTLTTVMDEAVYADADSQSGGLGAAIRNLICNLATAKRHTDSMAAAPVPKPITYDSVSVTVK